MNNQFLDMFLNIKEMYGLIELETLIRNHLQTFQIEQYKSCKYHEQTPSYIIDTVINIDKFNINPNIFHELQERFTCYNLTISEQKNTFVIKIKSKPQLIPIIQRNSISINIDNDNNKIMGVIIGGLIGDVLGTRYDGQRHVEALKNVQDDLQSHHLPVLGSGPWTLLPGQIKYTELAIIFMKRLPDVSKISLIYLAKAYLDYFLSGVSNLTKAELRAMSEIEPYAPYENIYYKMIENSDRLNKKSITAECLIRIYPLTVLNLSDDKGMLSFIQKTVVMTHPNPVTIDYVLVFIIALRVAIRGGSKEDIWEKAFDYSRTNTVQDVLLGVMKKKIGPENQLGLAIHLAFQELLYGENFEKSIIKIISLGGDTGINSCIVGSLLGAYYGYESLSTDWLEEIKNVVNPRVHILPELDLSNIEEFILKFRF